MVGKEAWHYLCSCLRQLSLWSCLRQLSPTLRPQTKSSFVSHIGCFLLLTVKFLPICYLKWGECLEFWRFKIPVTWAQRGGEDRDFLCMDPTASWQLHSSQPCDGFAFFVRCSGSSLTSLLTRLACHGAGVILKTKDVFRDKVKLWLEARRVTHNKPGSIWLVVYLWEEISGIKH